VAGDTNLAARLGEETTVFALVRVVADQTVAGGRQVHGLLPDGRICMADQAEVTAGRGQAQRAGSRVRAAGRLVATVAGAGLERQMLIGERGEVRMTVGGGA
jgi:hypothetical protein